MTSAKVQRSFLGRDARRGPLYTRQNLAPTRVRRHVVQKANGRGSQTQGEDKKKKQPRK